MDKKLNWSAHSEELVCKLRKGSYVLRQLSQVVNQQTLKIVYYAFIYSHISYGIIMWGGTSKRYLSKIFSAQKNAVRALTGLPLLHSCKGFFKRYDLMTIHSIYIFCCILHTLTTKDCLTLNKDIHSHFTRRNADFHTDFYRSNVGSSNPVYMGAQMYNKLPRSLKALRNKPKVFKSNLKKYLVERELYCIEDL